MWLEKFLYKTRECLVNHPLILNIWKDWASLNNFDFFVLSLAIETEAFVSLISLPSFHGWVPFGVGSSPWYRILFLNWGLFHIQNLGLFMFQQALVQLLLDSVFTSFWIIYHFPFKNFLFLPSVLPRKMGPLVVKLLSVSRWSQQNTKLSMEPFMWDSRYDHVRPVEAQKITAPLPIPSFLFLFSPLHSLFAFESPWVANRGKIGLWSCLG